MQLAEHVWQAGCIYEKKLFFQFTALNKLPKEHCIIYRKSNTQFSLELPVIVYIHLLTLEQWKDCFRVNFEEWAITLSFPNQLHTIACGSFFHDHSFLKLTSLTNLIPLNLGYHSIITYNVRDIKIQH